MQKKYRFSNGYIELEFEMRTGELLAMTDLATGENILKCHSRLRSMPFRLVLRDGREAWPVRNMTLINRPEMYAVYQESEAKDGRRLHITYPAVAAGDDILPIRVCVEITLLADSRLTQWSMTCEYPENDVQEVQFPALNGIYLGETWRDDALLYPQWRGIRVENPVEIMPERSARVGSRWMEYFQSVDVDHVNAQQQKDGTFAFRYAYGSCCSMRWMALTDETETFYMASHDGELRQMTLLAETFGPALAGMNFAVCWEPEPGKKTFTAPCAVAGLFPDWHDAAAYYGKWLKNATAGEKKPARAPWTGVHGDMVCHYDFKDQCGDIQHRYRDLPSLRDFCLQTGVHQIMLAGWDHGGFNVHMPMYTYDPELGTEEEFRTGVRALMEAGIHVACYVNADVVNRETEPLFPELFRNGCAIGADGSRMIRIYSNKAFVDYQMCACSEAWTEHLRSRVHYLTDVIGCDGVYFDCLSTGEKCYSKDHGHAYGYHTTGRRELLKRLYRDYIEEDGTCSLAIFGEALTDALGDYLCGQLGTTFMAHRNAFPEMYLYAFPDHPVLDMVYPFRSQNMRASPVSYWWKELIDRVFLLSMNFWIYDDEEYGSFRNDPVAWAYIRRLIAIRTEWFTHFGRGLFIDEDPFTHVTGGRAKAFRLDDGSMMITFVPDGTGTEQNITFSGACGAKAVLIGKQDVAADIDGPVLTLKVDQPVCVHLQ